MNWTTPSRIARLTALLLFLCLSVACKSKSAGTSPPVKVLRIGYLPITDHLTVIAKARSSFHGVDFQPLRFGSWPELSEALKAGQLDGAFVLSPIALELRAKGVPLKAVLLGHRNGSAVIVRQDSTIHVPADLVGKTIAIPNRFSTHNILLHKLLERESIEPAKVKVLELPPPEMVNALATKRIDAFIVAEPFGAQAEAQGVGRVLTLSKDIWSEHICCVLTLVERVITDSPDAVQELVNGLVDTSHFIERDPTAAAQAAKPFLGQNSDVIIRALTNPKGRVTYEHLSPEVSDFAATQDALHRFGISNAQVDLATYVDDHFGKVAYSNRTK
ncbi:MAG TPA: ABC transporter substrate-binding protein [Polyangiaceae bacterium]|nr:ABC transporter substrate-binding protein [Polyangiaceae bacterium]